MELNRFKDTNRNELSMIEVAYAILEETGDVYNFTELLIEVQEYLGLDEKTLEDRMARFYTELNVDGRFISLGENRWGLRIWYPIDSIDEEIVNSIDDDDLPRRLRRKKKRKLNAFDETDDMIDYNDDDPEDVDDIYDDLDEEDIDDLAEVDPTEDEETDNEELGVYARDLSELGEEELDIDEEEIEIDEELEEDSDDDLDLDEEIYIPEEDED